MRALFAAVVVALVFGCPAGPLLAQSNVTISTDVGSELNARLAGARTVRKQRWHDVERRVCRDSCCGKGCEFDCEKCRVEKVQELETYTDVARSTSLDVVRVSDLLVNRAQLAELPESVEIAAYRILNCSANEASQTINLSRTVSVGHAITKMRSVSTGQSIHASLQFDLGKFGRAGTDISLNTSVLVSDTEAETRQEQIMRSVSFGARPRGNGYWTITQFMVYVVTLEIPFSGTVVFDGDIDGNIDGITKASQLLSEQERTFAVEGLIRVSSASEGYVRILEAKADPAECESVPGTVAESIESSMVVGSYSTIVAKPNRIVRDVTDTYFAGENPIAGARRFAERITERSAEPRERALPDKRLAELLSNMVVTQGTPGNLCYIAPCNYPYDGYREVCYFDEEGWCQDCSEEFDAICAPLDENLAP
jgi:hypothetical protein